MANQMPRDYTPGPSATRRTPERLAWNPTTALDRLIVCRECGLIQREHINSLFCPEWRLRQLDGDR